MGKRALNNNEGDIKIAGEYSQCLLNILFSLSIGATECGGKAHL